MSSFGFPCIENLLAQWWGVGPECFAWAANFNLAANYFPVSGGIYQLSDFFAFYPKFGEDEQAIINVSIVNPGNNYVINDSLGVSQPGASGAVLTVSSVGAGGSITELTVTNGGTGYNTTISIASLTLASPGLGYFAGDVLTIVQAGASGGQAQVMSINPVNGAITSLQLLNAGTGYSTANGLVAMGGHGTGATVNIVTSLALVGGSGTGGLINITQISPYSGLVPQVVVQAYINLALASLAQARWGELWNIGMGLYVAHFVTMYLRSEGAPGTTAQSVAASGIERGLLVSKSAGDVSAGLQMLDGMEEWGAFRETTYGTQLITYAQVVGMGPMLAY